MYLSLSNESVVAGQCLLASGEMDEITGVSLHGISHLHSLSEIVYIAVKRFQDCESRSLQGLFKPRLNTGTNSFSSNSIGQDKSDMTERQHFSSLLATPQAGNRVSLYSPLIQKSTLTVLCLVVQSCPTLCDPRDHRLLGSSVHGNSPGKNTGMGCHALLQGIFPTQGLNPGLPHCKQILYHLSNQGSPDFEYILLKNK